MLKLLSKANNNNNNTISAFDLHRNNSCKYCTATQTEKLSELCRVSIYKLNGLIKWLNCKDFKGVSSQNEEDSECQEIMKFNLEYHIFLCNGWKSLKLGPTSSHYTCLNIEGALILLTVTTGSQDVITPLMCAGVSWHISRGPSPDNFKY